MIKKLQIEHANRNEPKITSFTYSTLFPSFFLPDVYRIKKLEARIFFLITCKITDTE